MTYKEQRVFLVEEAKRIVEEGKRKHITLRLIGAIAFRIHCPKFAGLHEAFQRELSDIDIVAKSKQQRHIKKLMETLNYTLERSLLIHEGRYFFVNPAHRYIADVFFDELKMCHTINFRHRLEIDYPTLPLADLLLEKMQIIKFTEKDLKDSIMLIREHDVGKGDSEMINSEYIASLLSKDWGFYYTSTTNLKRIKKALSQPRFPWLMVLEEEDIRDVKDKIDKLIVAIERKPKSLKWKLRAKVGTSVKWYSEVEGRRGTEILRHHIFPLTASWNKNFNSLKNRTASLGRRSVSRSCI